MKTVETDQCNRMENSDTDSNIRLQVNVKRADIIVNKCVLK